MEVEDSDKEDSEEEYEEAYEEEIKEAEVEFREELMSAIEFIRREKKKNKKLQVELDKKKDTQELEQMITKLKVQIEEDKRIEEALKEQLEGKEEIIGNLEAEIVTLRKDIQKKNRIAQKFWMTLLAVKNLILISLDLDTIKQKKDQAPKQ
jgi:hypothetical protein